MNKLDVLNKWCPEWKTEYEGPWTVEPDREFFIEEKTKYSCLLRRATPTTGAWCGYVGVTSNHPFYKKHCEDIKDIDVHEGLSYSNKCEENQENGICFPVEDRDNIWVLGFSCSGPNDLCPKIIYGTYLSKERPEFFDLTYKNIEYVRNECKRLAYQLFMVEKGII